MAVRKEIHVGDFGTKYIVPVYDNDETQVNFDPSGATTKKIFFRQPGVTNLVEKAATVEQRTVKGVPNVWCLTYTVTQSDVTNNLFHIATGLVRMQAELDYGTGKWKSNVISTGINGEELRIFSNLE